ncbi:MAG: PAS domain-containing protein [bacterium]
MIIFNPSDLQVVNFNPAAGRLLETGEQTVAGQELTDIFEPLANDFKQLKNKIENVVRENLDPFTVEMLALNSRQKFQAEIFSIPAGKRPLGGMLVEQNITNPSGFLRNKNLKDEKEIEPVDKVIFERINFLQNLVDAIPFPVYYKDAQKSYLGCNKAFEELVGRPEEELVGKTTAQFFSEQYAGRTEEKDERLLAHPGEQIYKEKIEGAAGAAREIVHHKVTFDEAEGEAGGLIGVMLDVTDETRKRRKLDELTECLLQLTADPLENFDRLAEICGRLLAGDNSFYFRREEEDEGELFGEWKRTNCRLMEPEILEDFLDKVAGCEEGNIEIYTEEELTHCRDCAGKETPEGCPQLETLLLSPVDSDIARGVIGVVYTGSYSPRPEDKQILELVAAALAAEERRGAAKEELEKRKELQKKVEESERKFRQVAENVRGVFWLFGPEFENLFYVNSQVVDLFNITPQELYDSPWMFQEKVHPPHRNRIENGLERVQGGEIVDFDVKGTGELEDRWFHFTFTPITNLKGEMSRVAGAVQDVTERIETQQELKAAHQKLKEKTAQLVHNEKMTALGELTASVAHELNQPLNVIKIIAQSLQRDLDRDSLEEEYLEEDLADVIGQVDKMAEIIDHMRVYSRRSSGEMREDVDLNDIFDGVFKFVEQQLKNHDIRVQKDYAQELPEIKGDSIRIEQIFMNLVTNARNALDEVEQEEKLVTVRTDSVPAHASPLAGDSVVGIVKDNGSGIPEDIQEKIFEPFFTTREPGEGTGLGLSVSSEVVEEHDGEIELETRPGGPTVFKIYFPVND